MPYKYILSIFLISINIIVNGQARNKDIAYSTDSTLYANTILKNGHCLLRFYHIEGLYLLTAEYNEDGFYYELDESINTAESNIDLIFNADTFEIGFINRVLRDPALNFDIKFINTLKYYYPCERGYSLLTYIDNNFPQFLIRNKQNTNFGSYTQKEFFVPYCGITPSISYGDIINFRKVLLEGVNFSRRRKKKLGKYIYFSIETTKTGTVENIKLLSKLSERRTKTINNNIFTLIGYKIHPGRARNAQKLKAGFYIEI